MENKIQKLLSERYFLTNENSWEQLAERVSDIYPPIIEDIKSKAFIPSSPTLMNANTKGQRKGTLSSCFTMGLEDSIEGIFDALKEAAIVTKAGGGVGYNFSKLRASNSLIKSLNRTSSGPLPFMGVFSETLDSIQQGGVRRGAGMGMLDCDHKSILEFIRAKKSKGVLERMNLSVRMKDSFYKQLQENPDSVWMVKDVVTEYEPLMDNGKPVTVKQLWDEIIECAWQSAEPGIFNSDIATRQCTVTNLDDEVLCNPCNEYVNPAYSSCNLGSINAVKCITNGKFDWKKFEVLVRKATRFLNNVIDVNEFPIEKIKEKTLQIRPIGLGIMGYAHLLYLINLPFNSKEANDFCDELFYNLTMISMHESCEIAKETGKSYPCYDEKTFFEANKRLFQKRSKIIDIELLERDIKQYGIANSCNTSEAPTGSISFIADVSSGIEPVFALTYARKIEKLNREYEVVYLSDPVFGEYLNNNFDEKTKEKILQQVSNNRGSCQLVKEIPEEMRKVFVTATDLTPMEHLESLSKVAVNVSTNCSKTVNLPSNATKEEISELYLKAHELGVIGVTVYRDGCRDGILVHQVDENNKETIVKNNAPKRPKSLPGHVYRVSILNKVTNESEKWIIFIGLLNDEPYEIIAGKINGHDFDTTISEGEIVKTRKDGKKVYQFVVNGYVLCDDIQEQYMNPLREYATRLMSLALRHGAGVDHLQTVIRKSGTIVDFNQAIGRVLARYIKEVNSKEKCPTCNAELKFVEGCVKCSSPDCSYSRCG